MTDRFAICQQSSRKTIRTYASRRAWRKRAAPKKNERRKEWRAERDGYMGHTRKGAIDLSQKEAAVSGLFFNESVENEGAREKE